MPHGCNLWTLVPRYSEKTKRENSSPPYPQYKKGLSADIDVARYMLLLCWGALGVSAMCPQDPHEARKPTPARSGGSHGARDPHRRQGGQRRWHHAFALRGDDASQADDSRWQAVAPRGIVSELHAVEGPPDGIPVRAEEGYTSSKITNQIGPARARGRQGARIIKDTDSNMVLSLLRPSRVVGPTDRSLHHADYAHS